MGALLEIFGAGVLIGVFAYGVVSIIKVLTKKNDGG